MAAGAGSSELQKAVDKLLKREPGWRRAIQPPDKGAKPGGKGVGRPASGTSALELVEEDASARQYWETPLIVRTSDGLLTFEVQPIKRMVLRGNTVFDFAEPPPEAP